MSISVLILKATGKITDSLFKIQAFIFLISHYANFIQLYRPAFISKIQFNPGIRIGPVPWLSQN